MDYFKLSRFFLVISVVSVVVVLSATQFPFIVGKYVFFRTAITLAFILFLLGVLLQPEEFGRIWKRSLRRRATPLFFAVSAFVALYLIAAFLGVDPALSFWSNLERGDGGFHMLHYYLFFALLTLLFERYEYRKIFTYSLGAAVLVVAYGVLSSFGIPGLLGPSLSDVLSEEGQRFEGALGNPAYFSAYVIFILFFVMYLAITESSFTTRRIFWLFVTPLFLFFFWFARTRGTFIGLAAGTLAGAAYFFFTLHGDRWKWAVPMLFLLVIGSTLLVSFSEHDIVQFIRSAWIFDIARGQTLQMRFLVWNVAWESIQEQPLAGWGPENFSTAFNRHFDPRIATLAPPSLTWFDRAHNVVFDYLATIGVLGFLGYLSMFGAFYWQFFRSRQSASPVDASRQYREEQRAKEQTVRALLFALPIAYGVQGLALFDTLPVYLNLFLFFAFANYYFPCAHSEKTYARA